MKTRSFVYTLVSNNFLEQNLKFLNTFFCNSQPEANFEILLGNPNDFKCLALNNSCFLSRPTTVYSDQGNEYSNFRSSLPGVSNYSIFFSLVL